MANQTSRPVNGRPCTLAELGPAVIEAVQAGLFDTHAAEYAGISRSTLMKWLQRGRKVEKEQARPKPPKLKAEDAEFLHFLHTIKKARAERLMCNKRRIDLAAEGGTLLEETVTVSPNGTTTTKKRFAQPVWQAAAWLVEREDPDHHSPSAKLLREMTRQVQTILKLHGSSATMQQMDSPSIGGDADANAI